MGVLAANALHRLDREIELVKRGLELTRGLACVQGVGDRPQNIVCGMTERGDRRNAVRRAGVFEHVAIGGHRRKLTADPFRVGEQIFERGDLAAARERRRVGQHRFDVRERARVGRSERNRREVRRVRGERSVRASQQFPFGTEATERPDRDQQQRLKDATDEDERALFERLERRVAKLSEEDEHDDRVEPDDVRRGAERRDETEGERPNERDDHIEPGDLSRHAADEGREAEHRPGQEHGRGARAIVPLP